LPPVAIGEWGRENNRTHALEAGLATTSSGQW